MALNIIDNRIRFRKPSGAPLKNAQYRSELNVFKQLIGANGGSRRWMLHRMYGVGRSFMDRIPTPNVLGMGDEAIADSYEVFKEAIENSIHGRRPSTNKDVRNPFVYYPGFKTMLNGPKENPVSTIFINDRTMGYDVIAAGTVTLNLLCNPGNKFYQIPNALLAIYNFCRPKGDEYINSLSEIPLRKLADVTFKFDSKKVLRALSLMDEDHREGPYPQYYITDLQRDYPIVLKEFMSRVAMLLGKVADVISSPYYSCKHQLRIRTAGYDRTYQTYVWPVFRTYFPFGDLRDGLYKYIMKFHPFYVSSQKFLASPSLRRKLTKKEIMYLISVIDVTRDYELVVSEAKVFKGKGRGVERDEDGKVVTVPVHRADGKTIRRGVFLKSSFKGKGGKMIEVSKELLEHYEYLRTQYYQNLTRKRLSTITKKDDKLNQYLSAGYTRPGGLVDTPEPVETDDDAMIKACEADPAGEALFMTVCEIYNDMISSEKDIVTFRAWMADAEADGKDALKEETIKQYKSLTPDKYECAGFSVLEEMAFTFGSVSQAGVH